MFSLASTAHQAKAIEGAGSNELLDWVREVEKLCAGLREGVVRPAEWQEGFTALQPKIPLHELLSFLDFDRLHAMTSFAERGVATKPVRLRLVDNAPSVVYTKFFAVGDRRAVIPHGHLGMASGHLVLKGAFHLRQYDRLGIEDGRWLVRQTVDRMERSGALSTISDERDNVHWLVADGDSYTLDFIMAPARPTEKWTVQNLDMDAAERIADLLSVPEIGVEEALHKYGRVE